MSELQTLLLNIVVFVVMSQYVGQMGGCPKEMKNCTRFSLSWNTSDMSVELPKYHWHSAATELRVEWQIILCDFIGLFHKFLVLVFCPFFLCRHNICEPLHFA